VLRLQINQTYLKRTIRPNYAWTQATPASCFLDPAWNRLTPFWPGMVYVKTSGENVMPLSGQTGSGLQGLGNAAATTVVPYGLGALYVGGDGIDEPLQVGINTFAVWKLTPDAEFEILAPAFDTNSTWVDPGDGTETLVYGIWTTTVSGSYPGQLIPAAASGVNVPSGTVGTSFPVARLLKVASPTKIVIGGLLPHMYNLTPTGAATVSNGWY
jgi:hypothetical protein